MKFNSRKKKNSRKGVVLPRVRSPGAIRDAVAFFFVLLALSF